MNIPVAKNNADTVNLALDSVVLYSTTELATAFASIEAMDDYQVYSLVKQYYEIMLDDIFEKKELKQESPFTKLFTIPRFIITLTQVMYTISPDSSVRRRLNKMSYDYLVLSNHDKDKYVETLLMSKTVNRDRIPKLCALNISEDFSSLLALARYSSENETLNVKRLNKVLMAQPESLLSEQLLVDIYINLFDHVLPLFTGVMLDVQSPHNMNENASQIYALISLAILDIMEALPMDDIQRGLKMFIEDKQMRYPDSPTRINLEACSSSDYPRLLTAIDLLKEKGIYLGA